MNSEAPGKAGFIYALSFEERKVFKKAAEECGLRAKDVSFAPGPGLIKVSMSDRSAGVSVGKCLTHEQVIDMGRKAAIDHVADLLVVGMKTERSRRRRKRLDDTSWTDHFRRWSVQVYVFIAGLGVFAALPDVLSWVTTNKVMWSGLVSPEVAQGIMVAASVLGVVLRKVRQSGLHDD